MAKADKQSYDTGYSKRFRNPFYFTAKAIKAAKFVSFNQRSVRPSGSGGPGHVEERCYSIFVSQKGPISHLFDFCEKERWRESPSSQPKGPEQKYSVSAIQDGRDVLIKRNAVTRGQNVQDRPEGCILSNPPVSESQEVCQIPVERPSIRILLPLLRAFSSSSGFYKTIKSPYLSFERAQCKNNNWPRRHAPNDIFRLADGTRDTDIHTSTLRVSDQYHNVLLWISRGDRRFWGNDFEPSEGETPQSRELLPENPRKGETNSQGTKQTDWKVIAEIAVLPAPLHYHHLQHQQIQKLISHNSSEEKGETSVEAKKELLWWKENLTLCNGRSLISQ